MATILERRKALLLASCALFTLPAAEHAIAACETSGADPVTLSCLIGTMTTTANTTNSVTPNGFTSDRTQQFAADLIGQVGLGGIVDGYGLALATTKAGGGITFNNSGTVSATTALNDAALGLAGNGGLVTYSGNGSASGWVGLRIYNTGSGGINVGTAAFPVVPNYTGWFGLAVSSESGAQNVFLSGGTVTVDSASGTGISVAASTEGAVAITTTGNTAIVNAGTPGTGWGIRAASEFGAVTITSNANIGAAGAEFGIGIGGQLLTGNTVNIAQTGGTIFAREYGIYGAFATGAALNITTDAGSAIAVSGPTSFGSWGINAISFGAGPITVTANGTITGADTGISAFAKSVTNTSDVRVTANGTVSANVTGIFARDFGSGNVVVSGSGTIGGGVTGVEARGNSGTVIVDSSGSIAGGTTGIAASSYVGSILITGTGLTTGFTGNAIDAKVIDSAGGNITVDRNGKIEAGATGIRTDNAATLGGSTITIGNDITAGEIGVSAATVNGLNTINFNVGRLWAAGTGIDAFTVGGAIQIATSALSTIETSQMAEFTTGIFARSSQGGAIAITSAGNIGTAANPFVEGIYAETRGTATITQSGGTIRALGTGINGLALDSGTLNITTHAGSTIAMDGGVGILATASGTGTGAVSVTTNGLITGVETGIRLESEATSASSLSVTANNTILADMRGIEVAALGTGNVSVTANSSVGPVLATATSGTVSVYNSGIIDSALAALEVGTQTGSITIANSGTIAGGTGISTSGGSATVTNSGTITGTGGTAIAFSGMNNTLVLAPGGSISGNVLGSGGDTLKWGGSGSASFDVSQIGAAQQYRGFAAFEKTGTSAWTLTGTSTYTGPTTVSAGTLSVNGNLASSSGITVNEGAALGGNGILPSTTINGGTLAPGNSIGTVTVNGNLTFLGAGTYLVDVSPTAADRVNVTGTATLGGTVTTTKFEPGSYIAKSHTILSAAGGRTGTFNTLDTGSMPGLLSANLSYTATDVRLNLTAVLPGADPLNPSGPGPAAGPNALTGNQTNVGTALVNGFNTSGGIGGPLATLFVLPGSALPAALSQVSGEIATGAPTATFRSGDQFLGLMLDPFLETRVGDGGPAGRPLGYAPEPQMTSSVVAAYEAGALALAREQTERRWSIWGAAYGAKGKRDGDATVGSHALDAQNGGFAAGTDYRVTRDTVIGLALGGGVTTWSLDALGTGRGENIYGGAYASTKFGNAYLALAGAYGRHELSTERSVMLPAVFDKLTADYTAQSYGGRAEAGYRLALANFGFTPYAAGQAQSFLNPAYAERSAAGGAGFALAYAERTTTQLRSELGARFDSRHLLDSGTLLILRARGAWVHDFSRDNTAVAAFQALPGFGFTVTGAASVKDAALVSAGSELRFASGITLASKFDGEFSPQGNSYGGTATLRYAW